MCKPLRHVAFRRTHVTDGILVTGVGLRVSGSAAEDLEVLLLTSANFSITAQFGLLVRDSALSESVPRVHLDQPARNAVRVDVI